MVTYGIATSRFPEVTRPSDIEIQQDLPVNTLQDSALDPSNFTDMTGRSESSSLWRLADLGAWGQKIMNVTKG